MQLTDDFTCSCRTSFRLGYSHLPRTSFAPAKQIGPELSFWRTISVTEATAIQREIWQPVTGLLSSFSLIKKQGHCEFFASSFALLLRAAGVPCRLVGGYLGGEYNELGGYYLVTDDKAHVWVEAYIEGSGWVRIDPSSFATNAGEVWTTAGSRSLKLRIALVLDSLNYAWNRSVISYDFEQQMNIARNVGSRLQGLNPSKMLRSFTPYFAGILLLAGLLFAARRVRLFSSREQRILSRFLKTVERKFHIPTGEGGAGLFEIASAADNSQCFRLCRDLCRSRVSRPQTDG